MNNSFEINYIKKCLALLETRLNWGASSEWTSYDFEKLSIAIEDATGVTLSITTLKRLWGKLKYTHIPTTTTLNTLAQFAGYNDWRDFKKQVPLEPVDIATGEQMEATIPIPQWHAGTTPATSPEGQVYPAKPSRKWAWWLLVLVPMAAAIYLLLISNDKPGAPVNPSDYSFSSNKIRTSGVPNSVIFNYDAAAAKDSVFISQSWDISRKVAVPKQQKSYSAIYYTPGYFRAKLMVGKQIVKEHDLLIGSNGWLATMGNDDAVPLYFKKEAVEKNGEVAVDEELLSQYHIALQPEPPVLRFFNVQELHDLKNDQFIFETTLKSDFHEGKAACQRVEILILGKNDIIAIPLCAKGCVGDLALYAGGTTVQSRDADLSGFGCDLDQWVTLRVEAKDRHMQFIVNGQTAYALTFPNAATDIVGLQYWFTGTGAIKDTRFIKGDTIIRL
ncbi:hypothetical protein [Chitinophaga sp.]|uniref:hypothetical protein n=1 Tax=Chitinophaga sp. TaxID=1869181 RepID=UPI002F929AF1